MAESPKDQPLHFQCMSHLIWERTLFQRPQQLMTRFVERGHSMNYLTLISSKRWWRKPDERDVRVGETGRAQNLPFLPGSKIGAISEISQRIMFFHAKKALKAAPVGRRVLWLQHPGFLKHIHLMPHDVLVYDRMDPFGAFKRTTAEVVARENQLLAQADVVFTGGRSMHRQAEGANPNMHCYPSGIDFPHFARGAEDGPVPEDLAAIPGPRFLYFGAVDERIDWALLEGACRARPDWSFVLVGPRIDGTPPKPDVPNLHELGGRPYSELPDYLRGCDACLIPWLASELTKYMSPTKTPEYLAAGRPVVSTRIPDVEADYGDEVFLADDVAGFVAACEKALAAGTGPARKPPQSRTWDEIAEAMEGHVHEALARRRAAGD